MAIRVDKVVQISTLLFYCCRELSIISSECRPGFEREFFDSNVDPILFRLNIFVNSKPHQNMRVTRECISMVDIVMSRIRKFKSVYGIIDYIYKVLRRTRDLLRGFELIINPESPKSLFDLSAAVVKRHTNIELYLHQCNPCFPGTGFNYSYNNYFNKATEIVLRKSTPTRNKAFDNTLKERVLKYIEVINRSKTLKEKIDLAKSFVNLYESLKTSSRRKNLALKVFRGFIERYEKYL